MPTRVSTASALLLGLARAGGLLAGDAFVDVSETRGIRFTGVNGASGEKYLVETMVAGAAWIDFDGDGFLDLYLVQAHRRPGKALEGGDPDGPTNVLYRNLGGGHFEDVTARAGVGDRGYGMGAAVGDYDNDGRPDLYITNYGPNVLYRNRGDGAFEDVTARAGVEAPSWSSSATWADVDGDGLLDLYVATYLAYDTRRHGACEAEVPGTGRKVPSYCHPQRFDGAPDVLYRNLGDGTFRDVSAERGIARSGGWLEAKGLGVVASDFDADGDVDLLVANDSVANTLWRNDGTGRFEDVALAAGFALNGDGATEAGMGICRGDIDADGDFDFFVTNFSRETNTLYLGLGGFFRDATIERRLARPGYLPLGFGTVFLDHDLDGDLDIYVANGHILDNAELLHPGEGVTYAQRDLLLENDGRGSFRDVSAGSGAWFARALVGRAVVAADHDNDGDLDLVVTNVAGPAVLLENRAGDGKRWIGIELAGPGGRLHNARVELVAGGYRRVHEVQTDGSYLAAHDARVVFALPDTIGDVGAARVSVRWPGSAGAEEYAGLAPGRYHRLSRRSQ